MVGPVIQNNNVNPNQPQPSSSGKCAVGTCGVVTGVMLTVLLLSVSDVCSERRFEHDVAKDNQSNAQHNLKIKKIEKDNWFNQYSKSSGSYSNAADAMLSCLTRGGNCTYENGMKDLTERHLDISHKKYHKAERRFEKAQLKEQHAVQQVNYKKSRAYFC